MPVEKNIVNSTESDKDDLLLELTALQQKYDEVSQSNSYRIGRKITYPIRAAKDLKHLLAKKYVMSKNINRVKRIIASTYGFRIASIANRPRVSLVVRSIEHPTSSTFIRMISPLSELRQYNDSPYVELVDGDRPSIARSAKYIIVQRTALIDVDAARIVVESARSNKAKLFVDTDDAFDSIDPTHPQYELQKDRIEALNYVLSEADSVWVSTDKLRDVYDKFKTKIIRNTVDEKVWVKMHGGVVDTPDTGAPLEVVYMGTKTHDGDFNMILPALKRLGDKYPGEFKLHVIGVASHNEHHPWLVVHHPPDGLYPNFVRWFSGLGPFDVGISPLEETSFNENKSDIKCLDYLAVGARPVVSDVEAYRNPGLDGHIVRVGNTESEWFNALEREVTDRKINRSKAKIRIAEGYRYIKQYRTPKKAAVQIANFIGMAENDA